MNRNNLPAIAYRSLIVGAIIIWISILLWASNRGLDLTDEGFYLYYFNMPVETKPFPSFFHLIQNSIFPFINCTIQNLRIERLILSILFAFLLGYSIQYYIKNTLQLTFNGHSQFSIYALSIAGVFFSYSFAPQTLSYNNFSTFFIIAACSLFFIDISKPQSKPILLFIYLVIGAFLGILFLIKFPNAILLPLALMGFYFVYTLLKSKNIQAVIKDILFRIIIMGCGYVLFYLIFMKGFDSMITLHKNVFDYSTQIGHGNDLLWDIYINSLKSVYASLYSPKFLYIILTLLCTAICLLKGYRDLLYFSLFVHLEIIILYKLHYGGDYNISELTITYFLWVFTLFLVNIIKNVSEKTFLTDQNKKRLLFSSLFLILPFTGILGTNNQIQIQLIFYMPFWFNIIYLLLENEFENYLSKPIYVFIILLALFQSYDGVVNRPYRINTNLFEQDQSLTVGKNEVILVDEAYKKQMLRIEYLLRKGGFKKNDYLYGYIDQNGLSYIFNARLLHGNWNAQTVEYDNCKMLQKYYSVKNKVRLFFILDTRYPLSIDTKNCLKKIGYDFDTDYMKMGDVKVDFSGSSKTVSIFAPI